MLLEKNDGGTKIRQTTTRIIQVVEGEGSGRILGILLLLGGSGLAWTAFPTFINITFIFGVLLALLGGALATQRQTMELNQRNGTWSSGGDIFFIVRFHSTGLLQDLGSVCIHRRESAQTSQNRRHPVFTYPISIIGKKADGHEIELRFGQYWSIEDAHTISSQLAAFLKRTVQDNSAAQNSTTTTSLPSVPSRTDT